jgi:hypothetical protein
MFAQCVRSCRSGHFNCDDGRPAMIERPDPVQSSVSSANFVALGDDQMRRVDAIGSYLHCRTPLTMLG